MRTERGRVCEGWVGGVRVGRVVEVREGVGVQHALYTAGHIYTRTKKHFKNEQRNRDDAAKKRANTSGVGESNNYYEDIYNIPPYNNTH